VKAWSFLHPCHWGNLPLTFVSISVLCVIDIWFLLPYTIFPDWFGDFPNLLTYFPFCFYQALFQHYKSHQIFRRQPQPATRIQGLVTCACGFMVANCAFGCGFRLFLVPCERWGLKWFIKACMATINVPSNTARPAHQAVKCTDVWHWQKQHSCLVCFCRTCIWGSSKVTKHAFTFF